jgi:hypothetical protein
MTLSTIKRHLYMFTDGLSPETPAILPSDNRAVAGGPERRFKSHVESDIFFPAGNRFSIFQFVRSH